MSADSPQSPPPARDLVETPVTLAIFLALGSAATIGGVLRGHLVFTELMNH